MGLEKFKKIEELMRRKTTLEDQLDKLTVEYRKSVMAVLDGDYCSYFKSGGFEISRDKLKIIAERGSIAVTLSFSEPAHSCAGVFYLVQLDLPRGKAFYIEVFPDRSKFVNYVDFGTSKDVESLGCDVARLERRIDEFCKPPIKLGWRPTAGQQAIDKTKNRNNLKDILDEIFA